MDTSQLKVLVVDDDPIVLEVTRERLISAGYVVAIRDTPVGTAALILQARVDIVILDVLMPGLRGDELARLLKKNPATARTAILLHSSLDGEELRPLIMTTGALGALEKSWSAAEFHSAFSRYASRVRALRSAPLDDPESGSFRTLQRPLEDPASGSFRIQGEPPPSSKNGGFESLADRAHPPSSRMRSKAALDDNEATKTLLEKIRSRFK